MCRRYGKSLRLLDQIRDRSDIISFGGGAPSVPPPSELVDELVKQLEHNPLRSCGYTGTRGIPELRSLIAADAKQYGGVEYDPDHEIIVTDGATESIFTITQTLVDSNSEVVLADPTYLGYKEVVELAGGRVRGIRVHAEDGYQPAVEMLKHSITKKTRAVFLLSPDNPTGRILARDFLRALIDLANDHDFWIVADDIYKHIIYEGEHVWTCALPNARERTITTCSFSKEAGIPGLRVGYTLAPAEIVEAMEKLKQYSTLAPNTLAQFGLLRFLKDGVKERYLQKEALPVYRMKRDAMSRSLANHLAEADTVKPSGAFYYFLDMTRYLSKMKLNEEDFCERLLGSKRVVAIPGRFFGEGGRNHIRLTFVSETPERIERGLSLIDDFAYGH